MVDLLDGYVGSSCVIKAKNNDLISMGTLAKPPVMEYVHLNLCLFG